MRPFDTGRDATRSCHSGGRLQAPLFLFVLGTRRSHGTLAGGDRRRLFCCRGAGLIFGFFVLGAGYSAAGEPLLRAALLHAKTRGAQGKGVVDYIKPKLVLALKEANRDRVALTARGGSHKDRHGFLRWGGCRRPATWSKRLTGWVMEELCKMVSIHAGSAGYKFAKEGLPMESFLLLGGTLEVPTFGARELYARELELYKKGRIRRQPRLVQEQLRAGQILGAECLLRQRGDDNEPQWGCDVVAATSAVSP